MSEDEAFDQRVRESIAASIRGRGLVPTIGQTAADMGIDETLVKDSFDRMSAAHVFIPRRDSSEILSYNPFSVDKTDFRVRSAGREWWALCGWDALGIPAALGVAGRIETFCADCGEPIVIDVDRDGTPSANGGTPSSRVGTPSSNSEIVLHVGVRAVDFWKDIYFT
ncbi:MAG: alkylmercury lyase family protein [Chloroflexota bacterium]|nr:alkylmercury lyase family protein [Chloroflexota bacterium]